MNKITLNFFGEKASIDKPNNLSSLRNEISRLYLFTPQDAAEIILTYNDNGDKIIISNDEDLKAFLNSKNTMIDLDISQNSQIFKDNLNQLKEDSLKDKKALEELLKRQEELNKLKETKFAKEKQEMKDIHDKIVELWKIKKELRKKIFEGMKQIDEEKNENYKKIVEIQKKLGLPISEPEKPKRPDFKMFFPFRHWMKFGNQTHPHFFKKGFGHHHKRPFEFNNMTEQNNSANKEFDFKMKTIDDWGKCLFEKTKEITNKLAEKFKGIDSFNISNSTNNEEEPKNEIRENKEIHFNIICDGCGMNPLVGKRYKCKGCNDFDYCEKCYEKNKDTHKHEFKTIEKSEFANPFWPMNKLNLSFGDNPKNFFQHRRHHHHHKFRPGRHENFKKKMEHCPTMGNIFDKEKITDKIVHFGVKCDGCGVFPIIGCRFKCAVCDNFDYCEECEKKLSEKHSHPFLKIYEPKMSPVFFKCSTKK